MQSYSLFTSLDICKTVEVISVHLQGIFVISHTDNDFFTAIDFADCGKSVTLYVSKRLKTHMYRKALTLQVLFLYSPIQQRSKHMRQLCAASLANIKNNTAEMKS